MDGEKIYRRFDGFIVLQIALLLLSFFHVGFFFINGLAWFVVIVRYIFSIETYDNVEEEPAPDPQLACSEENSAGPEETADLVKAEAGRSKEINRTEARSAGFERAVDADSAGAERSADLINVEPAGATEVNNAGIAAATEVNNAGHKKSADLLGAEAEAAPETNNAGAAGSPETNGAGPEDHVDVISGEDIYMFWSIFIMFQASFFVDVMRYLRFITIPGLEIIMCLICYDRIVNRSKWSLKRKVLFWISFTIMHLILIFLLLSGIGTFWIKYFFALEVILGLIFYMHAASGNTDTDVESVCEEEEYYDPQEEIVRQLSAIRTTASLAFLYNIFHDK